MVLAAAVVALHTALAVIQAQSVPPPRLAEVEAVPVTQPVAPGARVRLRVKVVPREGLRIYAPGERTYQPVTLTLDEAAGVTAGKPVYPRATSDTFEGEPVRVYSGTFEIAQPVRVAGPSGRTVRVTGTLEYQACDDVMCYRPVKVSLGWDLSVR
jgi:hypothetical protein